MPVIPSLKRLRKGDIQFEDTEIGKPYPQNKAPGAEDGWLFRVLSLTEDPGSTASTHVVAHNSLWFQFQRIQYPLLASVSIRHANCVFKHIQIKHPYM